jgi:hypothetical protein
MEFSAINFQVTTFEAEEIKSGQEESDTRIILYLRYAQEVLGYTSAVVRSPDSDVFFILLHHCCHLKITVYLDNGKGKERKTIDMTALSKQLGNDWCEVLLGIYVFTGEDCTSAFYGRGKVGPLQKLEKHTKYHDAFR